MSAPNKVGLDDYLEAHGVRALLKLPRVDVHSSGALVLDRVDPLSTARLFVESQFTRDGCRVLHHFRGTFYGWQGTHYAAHEESTLRAKLWEFVEAALVIGKDKTESYKATTRSINDILDALRAVTHLPSASGTPPFWMGGASGKQSDAADLIACSNGLLNLNGHKLLPHSPEYFNVFALPFPHTTKTKLPKRWLQFLKELWPNDPQSISTLQELFGLLLTPYTRHQKIFLLVGPKRGGKGAILRLLRQLLGDLNVAAPTLDSLTSNFGLAPLINKSIAMISDARLSDRADQKIVAERLLSISGEDTLTVDQKYRESWTGKFLVRFVLATNELPRIADTSGALASRFIVLRLTKSFYGQEDHGLDEKLRLELPGILNWSLAGLSRLRKRGYFVQPESAHESVELLNDLGSPISAFLRDACEQGAACAVSVTDLFEEWREWCRRTGREHWSGTQQSFGRDLHAALPGLRVKQPRRGDVLARIRVYEGIGIIKNENK